MKRKIFSALLALSLMACISLPAFAEKPNYELNGYEYDSVADLENCIRTHSAVKHPDQPYLSTMKVLWPLLRSSLAPMRVKTRSTTPMLAALAGTKEPICAMSAISAV